jgi:hypothetical protein
MQKSASSRRSNFLLAATLILAGGARLLCQAQTASGLRPPSVPLVACDPYFSIWSAADKLAEATTVHWTGKPHPLRSVIVIDGTPYRLMGKLPAEIAPLPQTGLEVLPTRTIYTFGGAGVNLSLTFTTPALPDDLMVYARPLTYLAWEAKSADGKSHKVEVDLEVRGQIAANQNDQQVMHSTESNADLEVFKMGTVDQAILAKKGDDLRIDWGYLYLAAPKTEHPTGCHWRGPSPKDASANLTAPGPASEIGARLSFGSPEGQPAEVDGTQSFSRYLILAYDDEFSIQYFKRNLRPYWRRNGDDAAALLKKAAAEYESVKARCEKFDAELMAALTKAGGEKYARLCALAYRQCYAANKVVADANGQPLMFPKENFSNGCIGTVDVIYPMAPQFLLFSPSLTKAVLVPILDYASSPRWRWPFAPHDLGTYPLANGQVYGGGERTEEDQMPVEETGNMLLLLAALAQVEGSAEFSAQYWSVLEKWADYLIAKGFDPENQLCTDDFAGHLAHNVNLSAKAICGLGAFAKLCEARGDKAKADHFMQQAKDFATRWAKEADDRGHYRLTFNGQGTWSQKYNLVWDRILGLNLFPDSVRRKEMDFYKTKQNSFGLPLDNRKSYTKLDWTLWTATLTQDRADFETLLDPVWRFLNETPNRVPMTDWFDTQNARQQGFQARSVVGGVFLHMLYDPPSWKAWASRDTTKAAKWAPLPRPPKIEAAMPTAERWGLAWRYTTEKPAEDWFRPSFDHSHWKEGPAGFGTRGTPGAIVRTEWNTADIWLTREFAMPAGKWDNLQLRLHHDEDAEVYLNGVLAAQVPGFATDYDQVPIRPEARKALKPGDENFLAVHCHQTTGGQYIDVGLVDVQPQD